VALGKSKTKARLKTPRIPAPANPAPQKALAPDPAAAAGFSSTPPRGLNALEMSGQDHAPTEAETSENFLIGHHAQVEEDELPPMGFAEALFGTSPEQIRAEPFSNAWPAGPYGAEPLPDYGRSPFDTAPDGPPRGFMEAAGQTRPLWNQQDYDAYPDGEEDAPPSGSGGPWLLVLGVVLIAAALAGLMAQLSGQAIGAAPVGMGHADQSPMGGADLLNSSAFRQSQKGPCLGRTHTRLLIRDRLTGGMP
jgi:hypothetical protein